MKYPIVFYSAVNLNQGVIVSVLYIFYSKIQYFLFFTYLPKDIEIK